MSQNYPLLFKLLCLKNTSSSSIMNYLNPHPAFLCFGYLICFFIRFSCLHSCVLAIKKLRLVYFFNWQTSRAKEPMILPIYPLFQISSVMHFKAGNNPASYLFFLLWQFIVRNRGLFFNRPKHERRLLQPWRPKWNRPSWAWQSHFPPFFGRYFFKCHLSSFLFGEYKVSLPSSHFGIFFVWPWTCLDVLGV